MSVKRNRKNSVKKERTIMLVSSAFVLAALTMTGLYMKGQEIREQDDGYTLDFTALENSIDEKNQEIGQKEQGMAEGQVALEGAEDDLDYMPLEAGSNLVEIPGLTDKAVILEEHGEQPEEQTPEQTQEQKSEQTQEQPLEKTTEKEQPENAAEPQRESAEGELQSVAARELHYSEASGLTLPVSGEVLLPYSMDSGIYFVTLDQYKRNPATLFKAQKGSVVSACAAGKVVDIFDDEEIGHAITIDLGDGYKATYGQLTDIQVSLENYVEAGDKLGTVAAPTKYYSKEGPNLYFYLEKDCEPLDPQGLF